MPGGEAARSRARNCSTGDVGFSGSAASKERRPGGSSASPDRLEAAGRRRRRFTPSRRRRRLQRLWCFCRLQGDRRALLRWLGRFRVGRRRPPPAHGGFGRCDAGGGGGKSAAICRPPSRASAAVPICVTGAAGGGTAHLMGSSRVFSAGARRLLRGPRRGAFGRPRPARRARAVVPVVLVRAPLRRLYRCRRRRRLGQSSGRRDAGAAPAAFSFPGAILLVFSVGSGATSAPATAATTALPAGVEPSTSHW